MANDVKPLTAEEVTALHANVAAWRKHGMPSAVTERLLATVDAERARADEAEAIGKVLEEDRDKWMADALTTTARAEAAEQAAARIASDRAWEEIRARRAERERDAAVAERDRLREGLLATSDDYGNGPCWCETGSAAERFYASRKAHEHQEHCLRGREALTPPSPVAGEPEGGARS